ncbi:hypothetical protein FG386_000080 [Cryptosporidium ryanae]|uniref:uncharacterized protein n=1 Tax=Cryptosporidium ryanae TaxID=515981 RepID=UPI00351A3CCC|nr:hypothetical protein FG386_000080 [Cryptosporidium ryanae]
MEQKIENDKFEKVMESQLENLGDNCENVSEEELDNAIQVLVSEKKVWENAFNLAKLELDEKNTEIESLKKLLNDIGSNVINKDDKIKDHNLLSGPFETKFDSNKVTINGKNINSNNNAQSGSSLNVLIKIVEEETRKIENTDEFISKLYDCENIESAYRYIIRAYVELILENQSQDQRIDSLNDELSNAQEAVQNLHRTIQNNQNSSDLVSIAYTSQIKSLQEDLLNACKDIDFWKEQCEQYMKCYSERTGTNTETKFSDLDLSEWCNLGSGINTMYKVEVIPNSYWWFISF